MEMVYRFFHDLHLDFASVGKDAVYELCIWKTALIKPVLRLNADEALVVCGV